MWPTYHIHTIRATGYRLYGARSGSPQLAMRWSSLSEPWTPSWARHAHAPGNHTWSSHEHAWMNCFDLNYSLYRESCPGRPQSIPTKAVHLKRDKLYSRRNPGLTFKKRAREPTSQALKNNSLVVSRARLFREEESGNTLLVLHSLHVCSCGHIIK